MICPRAQWVNSLRPIQNGRHFADGTFKCIFVNENVWISINISLKFVPKGQINNISALGQIMAWRQPSNKPLFEPMMVCLLMHVCVTRPQWVNSAAQWLQLHSEPLHCLGDGSIPAGQDEAPQHPCLEGHEFCATSYRWVSARKIYESSHGCVCGYLVT